MRPSRRWVVWFCGLAASSPLACASSHAPAVPVESGSDAGTTAPPEVPDANPTPPSVVGSVTPSHAFLARHREVLIGGYSSQWTNATRVDFGPGVTITNLSAAKPNLLAVDFGVDLGATPGPRDLTVTEADGGIEVDPGALTLDPPVALTFDGLLAQGSIAVAHVQVIDTSIPLDTTIVTDPFGRSTFANLAPTLPAGLSGTVLSATQFEADIEIFIDEPTVGPQDFDLVSGPPGGSTNVHFPGPQGLGVAARLPVTLTADAPVTGSIASKDASVLFAYTPPTASPTILDFAAASSATGADPAMLLLPSSGRWADELTGGALATWVSLSTDPIYAVYFDDSGSTGSYAVGLTATPAAASGPTSAGDSSMAGAVVAPALPFVLTGGLLTSSASQDWVAVSTGPSDGEKSLHVQSAGDPHTFLDVTIYDADGTTSIGGNETGGPVNARSVPLSASQTYYVVFSAGAGFDPSHGGYVGIIRLE